MEHRRGWRRRILAGFFLFMLFCTLVSRIYDSITIPKVLTGYSKQKSIETLISGTGKVKEKEVVYFDVFPGLKVESAAAAGTEVQEGDELFRFRVDSILEKKEELTEQLEKLKLNLERSAVASEVYEQVTQSELAQRELLLARKELEEGQQERDEAWAEYFVEKKRLQSDYEKELKKAEEELQRSLAQDEQTACDELEEGVRERDAALIQSDRQIEDLKAEIEVAKQEEDRAKRAKKASPSDAGAASTLRQYRAELEKLQLQLDRAWEDRYALEAEWERKLGELRNRYIQAQEESGGDGNGAADEKEELKKTYLAAIEQTENEWETAQEKLEALEKGVEDAQWNLELAARSDEYAGLTRAQQSRLAQIDRRLQELEIRSAERKIEDLDALLAEEGVRRSDRAGTVVLQELTEGKTSSGEERVSVAYGSRVFEAEFQKTEQELSVGDLLSVTVPGTNWSVEAVVGEMNLMGEETGTFQADLGELDIPIGSVTSYSCKKESEVYQNVIPLEALRRDMSGYYYCLVLRTRNAILGEEFFVERVDLTVLYQGSAEAAVEGALFDSDQIVTGSNQLISAGDRVRPAEG